MPVLGPAAEPVSYEDYMGYLRTTTKLDPATIADKIARARVECENYSRRAFISQQFDVFLDLPPGSGTENFTSLLARFGGDVPGNITLPYPPLRTVDGVYVMDSAGVEHTVDPSVYWVSKFNNPARLALRTSAVWPDSGGRVFEVFRARITSGYATPFTADTSTGMLLAPRHGFLDGDQAIVRAGSGTELPDPLAEQAYYVLFVDGDHVRLAETPGGAPIDLTSEGDGKSLLGIPPDGVPSPIRRAILATAAADFSGKGPMEVPEFAKKWLTAYRKVRL